MLFLARKYRSLRIVIDPITYQMSGGKRVLTSLNGNFPLGLSIQFQGGRYETSDKKIIEALRKHPQYGYAFSSPEETVEPTREAIREINDRKEVVEKVRKTNPPKGAPVKPAIPDVD